ncbi:hypothetical protein HY839_04070 [Candidatus Azambacteria bacterium]|nr:hypothetical protein [Candidatus Azambacteria bacterium]
MQRRGGFRMLYASFAPFFSPLIEIVERNIPYLTRMARFPLYLSWGGGPGHPALKRKGKKKKSHWNKKR